MYFLRRQCLIIFKFLLISYASVFAEAMPSTPPIPHDNPLTKEKVSLGKLLYFDPRLSSDGTVSCNSCHNVADYGSGTDNLEVSLGVGGLKGSRNSPTVWNSAFWSVQFLDGRAESLEEQAKGPLVNPVEMAMADHDLVVRRVSEIPEYRTYFDKAFGKGSEISIDQVAQAIASFERTLITPNSPYDRFKNGDEAAMSPLAQKGMTTFASLGCTSCHQGALFNGPSLPWGQGFYMKFPLIPGSEFDNKYELSKDLGRYEATKNEVDKNFWRVPSLRNVARTAPYFHNGKVKTLDEAIQVMAATQLNRKLTQQEVNELVAFLTSLNGELPKIEKPKLPGMN